MILQLLFQIIFLSWPVITSAQLSTKPNCQTRCGDVYIPFPFGIGLDCYIDRWFEIVCNSDVPILTSVNLEVLDISLDGTIRVNHPVFYSCKDTLASENVNLAESPFFFSETSNRFTAVGCNNFAFMSSTASVIGGCLSVCGDNITMVGENSCYGIECCQTSIPSSLQIFNASIRGINAEAEDQKACKYAFLVEQQWFETSLKNPQNVENFKHVPVVVEWGIQDLSFDLYASNKSTSYNSTSRCEISSNATATSPFPNILCKCLAGFGGNPFLLEGCEDIDECKLHPCPSNMACENYMGGYNCYPMKESKVSAIVFGTAGGVLGLKLLILWIWWLHSKIKRIKEIKLKEKYFKQNGGLLLQQQLTSSGGNVDRSKLFDLKDLEKATDHFNVNRILGQGGQGTVYKGMLADGRIVAVKRSKIVNEVGKVDEFINEVVILSQINHRNIVKLLGCCLESEVPLLVYEFIPNGTLSNYLHDQLEELSLTWDMRLRIAGEVAEALCYLHFSASRPIYHRDVKSTNILLDQKYRAKVADFGTSKSITIDQTHVTTKVLGTFGYLDPEYFRSSQFTDKSDVYSYGVVLAELLTGKKPISSTRSEEFKGLAAYFAHSMEENHLDDILDALVLKQGKKEETMAVANLAKKCLDMNAKKRPTMKEVTMELERIRSSIKDGNIQVNYQGEAYEGTQSIRGL